MAKDEETLWINVIEVIYMKSKRRDKKGRFSDQKNLSKEKHERDYVKRVAQTWEEKLDYSDSTEKIEIKAGQLRRLCEYILQG